MQPLPPQFRRKYPSIERRPGLDRDTLVREYLRKNRPVVIPSDNSSWCARWTPEAIKSRFGDSQIDAEQTKNVYVGERLLESKPLRQLVDALLGGDVHERWKGLEFLAKVPDMRMDLDRNPPPFHALLPEEIHGPRSTLWIAPGKTMSSLHHDGNYDNLNMQLSGKKIFLLIEPSPHDALYRYGSAESPINPFTPDLARFPRFREVSPVEATLGPGDTLLVPKYWWHCVYAVEPSVNLATCFSWEGELSAWEAQEGVPMLHRLLSVAAAEMKRRGYRKLADTTRRFWWRAYTKIVPRIEPQLRGEL
jgi:hypothetical protein